MIVVLHIHILIIYANQFFALLESEGSLNSIFM